MNCPICSGASGLALTKEGHPYFECQACSFLFHRREESRAPEAPLDFYDEGYWRMEREEARRREQEDSFLRALELIYLSTVKVENVLDFGCGLGLTVDLLRDRLGLNAVGVDLSADLPAKHYLHRCELLQLLASYPEGFFDAIYSIEVFEHLEDPARIAGLLRRLLKPGGKMLVNTGTREYISRYDPEQRYIDPCRRGHISIYSLESFRRIASGIGYTAEFLGDRKYAVVLSPAGDPGTFPIEENLQRLGALGQWMPGLMREYMRLVFLEKEFDEKCAWTTLLVRDAESAEAERSALVIERNRLSGEREQLAAEVARLHRRWVPYPVWRRLERIGRRLKG